MLAFLWTNGVNQDILNILKAPESRSPRLRSPGLRSYTMRMAAIQLQVFDSRPQMQSVIERMDAEAAAGLERVSPKLEPDVRHAMSTMAVIGLAWGDLSTDIIQLGAERFLARADAGNITDESHQAKCTLKTAMDVLGGVADFFPGAVTLATVERLNY